MCLVLRPIGPSLLPGTIQLFNSLQTEQALFYDAVMLLAQTLRNSSDTTSDLQPMRVNCETDQSWAQGRSLVELMAKEELAGLSGRVKFNENRTRTDFHLDIMQILYNGVQQVCRFYCKLLILSTHKMSLNTEKAWWKLYRLLMGLNL